MPSNTFQGQIVLVDEVLQRDHDTTLEEFLTAARADGLSYDAIARQLTALVDVAGFNVTYQTARRWCVRLDIKESA